MKEKKIRDLVKPQLPILSEGSKERLVVPYCNSGYAHDGDSVKCSNGYSSNIWCTSGTESSDDVLF